MSRDIHETMENHKVVHSNLEGYLISPPCLPPIHFIEGSIVPQTSVMETPNATNSPTSSNAKSHELRRARDREKKRIQRQKPEFRQREKERNKLARRRARLDPLYRAREMQRDRFWRKQMRMNPEYRARERVRDMLAKQRLRQDPVYRARERLLQEARRKAKIYKIANDTLQRRRDSTTPQHLPTNQNLSQPLYGFPVIIKDKENIPMANRTSQHLIPTSEIAHPSWVHHRTTFTKYKLDILKEGGLEVTPIMGAAIPFDEECITITPDLGHLMQMSNSITLHAHAPLPPPPPSSSSTSTTLAEDQPSSSNQEWLIHTLG